MLIPAFNGMTTEFPFSYSTELYVIDPVEAVVINYLKVAAVCLLLVKGRISDNLGISSTIFRVSHVFPVTNEKPHGDYPVRRLLGFSDCAGYDRSYVVLRVFNSLHRWIVSCDSCWL